MPPEQVEVTCIQEGENDENITSFDMTTLVAFKPKVNLSYITIIFAKYDELMMRPDVFIILFRNTYVYQKEY
jgi:hypothetical protein